MSKDDPFERLREIVSWGWTENQIARDLEALLQRVSELEAALRKCIYRRRRDAPGADPSWRDAETMDEPAGEFIRRADMVAREALGLLTAGAVIAEEASAAPCSGAAKPMPKLDCARCGAERAERQERERAKRLVREALAGAPFHMSESPTDRQEYAARVVAEFIMLLEDEGEGHAKHPTDDECVYCHEQWPCEESR